MSSESHTCTERGLRFILSLGTFCLRKTRKRESLVTQPPRQGLVNPFSPQPPERFIHPRSTLDWTYHSPRIFLQINSPPVFFCNLFLYFFTGIRCGPDFFCNSHTLLGESRGYCTKTKQEWPDSGSTLENILVIFTKLIPRRIFCFANILVLMVHKTVICEYI